MLIEIVLAVGLLLVTAALLIAVAAQRRINKSYNKLLNSIVQTISAQKEINDKQLDINDNLGQNVEILGVHTKLIPPSVAMQAEAFLAWHNKRREEKDDG